MRNDEIESVWVREVPAPPRRVVSESGRGAIHCDRASGRSTRSARRHGDTERGFEIGVRTVSSSSRSLMARRAMYPRRPRRVALWGNPNDIHERTVPARFGHWPTVAQERAPPGFSRSQQVATLPLSDTTRRGRRGYIARRAVRRWGRRMLGLHGGRDVE